MDVIQLTPNLHQLRFPIGNAYLWQDPDVLTLIDTGLPGCAAQIADAISGLGRDPAEPRTVLLTHFHQDHVGSAAEIAGWGDVQVRAHEVDAPIIRGQAAGPAPNLLDWERPIFEQVATQLPPVPPVPLRVDRERATATCWTSVGERVWSGPRGTPRGSIAVHVPQQRVLFTGDSVARMPQGDVILGVFSVDREQAIMSLRRQAELDVEVVCFGHGEPLVQDAAAGLRAAVVDRPAEGFLLVAGRG